MSICIQYPISGGLTAEQCSALWQTLEAYLQPILDRAVYVTVLGKDRTLTSGWIPCPICEGRAHCPQVEGPLEAEHLKSWLADISVRGYARHGYKAQARRLRAHLETEQKGGEK